MLSSCHRQHVYPSVGTKARHGRNEPFELPDIGTRVAMHDRNVTPPMLAPADIARELPIPQRFPMLPTLQQRHQTASRRCRRIHESRLTGATRDCWLTTCVSCDERNFLDDGNPLNTNLAVHTGRQALRHAAMPRCKHGTGRIRLLGDESR